MSTRARNTRLSFTAILKIAALLLGTILALSLVQRVLHVLSERDCGFGRGLCGLVAWPVAAIIFALGIFRLFRASHARMIGMGVGGRDLVIWSFLMASAHGAELMLIPVLWSHATVAMHHISSI